MAQCKKILYSGERCSNRAIPGTDYCEQHRGVKPPQDSKKASVSGRSLSFPQWIARPSTTDEAPAFPGLHPDRRNILVAPQGIIWLGKQDEEDQVDTLFDRLVRLLSCLSQEMRLPGGVSVRMIAEETGAIIGITPPAPDDVDLSRFYDMAAAAAGLSNGLLYIGQEQTFIRYRDSRALRGYDAIDVQPPSGDELYLIDVEGAYSISPRLLKEQSLDTLLLRIAPLLVPSADLPDKAFTLAAPPLYRMLSRYFRDHYLHYRVAQFTVSTGNAFILFEISPRPDAPTGAFVPAFVLSYLDGLPYCTVFTDVGSDLEGRQMLVEWKHHYPCQPCSILEAFPSDSLLLFTNSPDFFNLCVSPAPSFFNGDDLISIHVPHSGKPGITPITNRENLPLEISLQLVHDPGPTPSIAALILDTEEIEWIRRLLYRLPGDAFETYTLCLGQQRAVLVGKEIGIESLPFGVPMRCVQDSQLFLPLHSRLVPDLPWGLLAEVLGLKDDVYTFLTPEFRLDLPQDTFAPLSRALVAKPGCLQVAFDFRSTPDLPKQSDRQPVSPQTIGEPEQKEDTQRSLPRTIESPKTAPAKEDYSVRKEALQSLEDLLLERAEFYREAGDYLSAALCFAMSGDSVNAARCYQEAANGIS